MPMQLMQANVDFQQHFAWGSRQDIVWGLGYRVNSDDLSTGLDITWNPAHKTDHLCSTFVQDEIFVAKNLWLTLGAKFEHNDYTGFENEPSGQLVWTPSKRRKAARMEVTLLLPRLRPRTRRVETISILHVNLSDPSQPSARR